MLRAIKQLGLKSVLLFLSVVLWIPVASAQWQLDNSRSSLSFTTTKNGKVTEVHRFTGLSGSIAKSGDVTVSIDLLSVATGIDIRDERMREFLFQTDQFATATVQASIAEVLKSVKSKTKIVEVEAELSLHGKTQPIALKLLATERGNQWVVSSIEPILINAADYELAEGVEKLREIAELASISEMVPVNFVLTFAK